MSDLTDAEKLLRIVQTIGNNYQRPLTVLEAGEIVSDLRSIAAKLERGAVEATLKAEDVEWIVNDGAELGVMIRGQAFFLYKGDSIVYTTQNDDGSPMMYRTVGKREFGECCHPLNRENPELIGTVSLDDCDRWKPLPNTTL